MSMFRVQTEVILDKDGIFFIDVILIKKSK